MIGDIYYTEGPNVETTANSYGDCLSMTFVPKFTGTYTIFAYAASRQKTGASYLSYLQLLIDGSSSDEAFYDEQDEWWENPWLVIKQVSLQAGKPCTVKIQSKSGTAGNNAGCLNPRIMAWYMQGTQYNYSATEATTTNSTYQDKGASLTFSPATQMDWLIIGFGQQQASDTNNTFSYRLDADGAEVSEGVYKPFNASAYNGFAMIKRLNLTAASHTFKFQIKSNNGSATAKIRNSGIIAIPLNGVLCPEVFDPRYSETESRSTTTSDAGDLAGQLTFTQAVSEYIKFFGFVADISAGDFESVVVAPVAAGLDVAEVNFNDFGTNNVQRRPTVIFAKVRVSAAASLNDEIYYWTDENNGVKLAGIDDRRIYSLMINQAGDPPAIPQNIRPAMFRPGVAR